jgi:hypothetical protein
MAFMDDHGPNDEPYFNVSHSVGLRAANYWADIMLVQYFINKIYTWGQMSSDPIFSKQLGYDWWLVNPVPDPNKDFKDLRKTTDWILTFQLDVLSNGGHRIATDSRVSRGKPFSSNINFTIHHMNYYYRRFVEVWNPGPAEWKSFLLNDYMLPHLCRQDIYAHPMK